MNTLQCWDCISSSAHILCKYKWMYEMRINMYININLYIYIYKYMFTYVYIYQWCIRSNNKSSVMFHTRFKAWLDLHHKTIKAQQQRLVCFLCVFHLTTRIQYICLIFDEALPGFGIRLDSRAFPASTNIYCRCCGGALIPRTPSGAPFFTGTLFINT
jgi:hypothetical protein